MSFLPVLLSPCWVVTVRFMQRSSGQSKLAAGPQLSSGSGLSSRSPHTADLLLATMWRGKMGGKEQSLSLLSAFGKGTLGANMWELLLPDASALLADNPTQPTAWTSCWTPGCTQGK